MSFPLLQGTVESRPLRLGVERAPRGFRVAEGVRSAWIEASGPFGRTPAPLRGTAAQKAGIRYERKVHEHLSSLFGSAYRPSQWFRFEDRNGALRWCQPDGLLSLGPLVVIFEVKARLVPDAWWQLRRLYEPVVRRGLRPAALGLCTITRNFDPHIIFPEPLYLIAGKLEDWARGERFERIGVYTWKP